MSTVSATLARCTAVAAVALACGPKRRARDAGLYLAHVEGALPLRQIASAAGQAVTSVHRAVRRIEALRDDPLIDRALDALAAAVRTSEDSAETGTATEAGQAQGMLSRLAEPGAFLMVAAGAGRAGVFTPANAFERPVALVPLALAATFAARDWVRATSCTGASTRYAITPAGRLWLQRQRTAGAGEAPAPKGASWTDSPVAWLARRKDQAGRPLLSAAAVAAAARLRADVDEATDAAGAGRDWRALSVGDHTANASAAASRAGAALDALGPGLADVAYRACCRGEGLESIETAMGWSARSGKVVLGIALDRLALHYGLATGS